MRDVGLAVGRPGENGLRQFAKRRRVGTAGELGAGEAEDERLRLDAERRGAGVLGGDQGRARPCERVKDARRAPRRGIFDDVLGPGGREPRAEANPAMHGEAHVVDERRRCGVADRRLDGEFLEEHGLSRFEQQGRNLRGSLEPVIFYS